MRQLLLIPSFLMSQLLMMAHPWLNSSVAETPLFVMPMVSSLPNSLSTPCLITSGNGELCIPLSVMTVPMKSLRRLLTSFYAPSSLLITNLSLITSTKTSLRTALALQNVGLILSRTLLLPLHPSVFNTSVLSSITWHPLLWVLREHTQERQKRSQHKFLQLQSMVDGGRGKGGELVVGASIKSHHLWIERQAIASQSTSASFWGKIRQLSSVLSESVAHPDRQRSQMPKR